MSPSTNREATDARILRNYARRQVATVDRHAVLDTIRFFSQDRARAGGLRHIGEVGARHDRSDTERAGTATAARPAARCAPPPPGTAVRCSLR